MTLREIREWFIDDTGRTDLVESDRYIRAGQRFLDDHSAETPKSQAEVEKSISQGDASVSVANVRAILDVRVKESGKKPNDLERIALSKFLDDYGDPSYLQNQGSPGTPLRYALGINRDDQPSPTKEEEHLILFQPVADGSYTLTVVMEYFSAPLQDDTDESWWSIVYPEVLVLAARRAVEVAHRNHQGVQEFEARINSRLNGIDSNLVDQESAQSNQMRNAW